MNGTRPDPGILYIISTPIGHLEDISIRALKTMRAVHLIAAEDTRRTRKLLSRYRIRTRLMSYREHTERKSTGQVLRILMSGRDVALVTDGGTPCISDPGLMLIQTASESGLTVIPVPGPSAVSTAVSICGLLADRFVFEGFLPRGKSRRALRWEELTREERAIVFFEAPHRMKTYLDELIHWMPRRRCAVCRELTKLHETVYRGYPAEILLRFQDLDIPGEYCIVVEQAVIPKAIDTEQLTRELLKVSRKPGSNRDIAESVARRMGLPFRPVYRRLIEIKNDRKIDRPGNESDGPGAA
ncbi:16S rRNA (cytidine(1402)-2'-O)-methyltransferase [bacterium]|nr:16S rRNA (cytidine(1402)-2'-O)-methyltransferase [candidate division CSSED10-310 bacterium]